MKIYILVLLASFLYIICNGQHVYDVIILGGGCSGIGKIHFHCQSFSVWCNNLGEKNSSIKYVHKIFRKANIPYPHISASIRGEES